MVMAGATGCVQQPLQFTHRRRRTLWPRIVRGWPRLGMYSCLIALWPASRTTQQKRWPVLRCRTTPSPSASRTATSSVRSALMWSAMGVTDKFNFGICFFREMVPTGTQICIQCKRTKFWSGSIFLHSVLSHIQGKSIHYQNRQNEFP